jgi:hypothetical protein
MSHKGAWGERILGRSCLIPAPLTLDNHHYLPADIPSMSD